jgi:hypothetical protein
MLFDGSPVFACKPGKACRRLAFAVTAIVSGPLACEAAENGLSNYLPGYYGDYAVAVAPAPGLYVYGTVYSYSGSPEGPKLNENVNLDATLYLTGFQYVTDRKFLDARVAFGSYTVFINGDLDATVPTSSGPLDIFDHAVGHGDTSFSPVILYWTLANNWHVSAYESIIAPTGRYDHREPLNVGRNYYSFDTVVPVTWLDPKAGWEVSLVPGLMINTENPETDYRTGTEFHLDAMLNRYLSQTFAVGLHGYAYTQLESDSGRGATASDLKGSSLALGPSILWVPSSLGIKGKIVGKWLHEFEAENRFEGDIISLTGVLSF